MKFLSMFFWASAISLLAIYLSLLSRSDWDKSTSKSVLKMMGFTLEGDDIGPSCIAEEKKSNDSFPTLEDFLWEETAFQNLPEPVKRYLHRAFLFMGESERKWEDKIKMLRCIEMEEEGMILLRDKWWVPFTAQHYVSASALHPGFVWDGKVSLPNPFPHLQDWNIFIRDSYSAADKKEYKHARMMGIVPVQDDLVMPSPVSGNLQRWLSLCPLFPTSLLPHNNEGVKWHIHEENQADLHSSTSSEEDNVGEYKTTAVASILNPTTSKFEEVEYRFDDQGLVASIYAKAAKKRDNEDGKVYLTPWESKLSDYEVMGHGMLIPRKVEVGWWIDGKFRPYYKAKYNQFNYSYF